MIALTGLALILVVVRPKTPRGSVVRPKTPRGDGNKYAICASYRSSALSSDPKPREGTETC
ncbi:Uncharacterised protein [Mycobacterium tuberculosis]|nr:Uncharacterised protein [Mycobacterium tuberculosis]